MSLRFYRGILVLVLIGSLPLSAGVVFHFAWLLWAGISLVGLACILSLTDILPVIWLWIRAPKPLPEAVQIAEDEEIAERGASPNSRPPCQLPTSSEIQSSDSLRTHRSGGRG